jgi:hypothetical protein
MLDITDIKKRILQSVFKDKFSKSEIDKYSELTDINVFNDEILLQTHIDNRVFLILEGTVQIKSESNESVLSLSSGFIGLSNLFPDILWQKYRIYSTCGLKVIYLDNSILSSLIAKDHAFNDYLYRQVLNLDLLLLHYYETVNLPSKRVDLISQVSNLDILSLKSGLYEPSIFKDNKDYLILHFGKLIHSSGAALLPGRVYDCSALPDAGEWMNLSGTQLFCSEQLISNQNLSSSAQRNSLEPGGPCIVEDVIHEISKHPKDKLGINIKQHFGQIRCKLNLLRFTKYWVRFRYIALSLICFIGVILLF